MVAALEARAGSPRDFQQTLDGLLNDWEIELRLGTLPRVPPRIFLRRPAVSRNLPPSFATALEHAIAQRTLKALPSKISLSLDRTHAAPLRPDVQDEGSASLEVGEVELQSRLTYSPESMLLSFALVDRETQTIAWTRTYSSEVPRLQMESAAASEKIEEYAPYTEHHAIALVTVEPTAEGGKSCLGAGWRSMRRFWNRKVEWGFEADFLRETGTLLGTTEAPGSLYSTYHFGLLVMGTWNFIGGREDPNRFRLALNTGIGGAIASGVLSAHVRSALEVRIAKSSALSLIGGYRPRGTPLLGSSAINPVGGLEWGMGLHFLF